MVDSSHEFAPTRRSWSHVLLALEVVCVVVPVTIVGGFYAILGLWLGTTSIIISLMHLSFTAWWFGVLCLSAGGACGILGLWLFVLISMKGAARRTRMAALVASAIGVATAMIALVLAERGGSDIHWWVVYLLVSPIAVVCHRAPACWPRA